MTDTPEKIMITMSDGRTVGFNKKQRLVRNSTADNDGAVTTVLDFVNGETRTFVVAPSAPNYSRFVAAGIESKIGDQIGGEKDIDDAVASVDSLLDRLNANEWYVGRAPGSFSGASVLAKALIEASGKTGEEIKNYLASKSHAEKLALRNSTALRPIIDRIEADKQKEVVDTASLLNELGVGETPARAKREKAVAE